MANQLKNLKITSTDLVEQGANPDAHIRLFKRKDTADGDKPDTLLKKCISAVTGVFSKEKEATTFGEKIESGKKREATHEVWEYCDALAGSLVSIILDDDLSDDNKRDMLLTSLSEFTTATQKAAEYWAAGKKAAASNEQIAKSEQPIQAIQKSEPAELNGENINQKEDTNNMKFDKSKMTPEDAATLEELTKKYGAEDEPTGDEPAESTDGTESTSEVARSAELHPEVKKALDEAEKVRKSQSAEIEGLKKNLEISNLTAIAKKYEIIGKKADELAPKLYELKKAGGTVYNDYIALLDEQVELISKSGMFTEIGKSTDGGAGAAEQINLSAAEIQKSGNMPSYEAIVKAFESNPELAAKYENEYMGGK